MLVGGILVRVTALNLHNHNQQTNTRHQELYLLSKIHKDFDTEYRQVCSLHTDLFWWTHLMFIKGKEFVWCVEEFLALNKY